jgi:hypothetical protein
VFAHLLSPTLTNHSIFSNGGLLTFTDYLLSTHYTAATAFANIHKTTIILDSCPGIMTFTSRIRAFAAPIQNTVLKIITTAIIAITYPLMRSLWIAGIITEPITNMREVINDTELIGKASRAYIYSNADTLVQAAAVEKHSQQAAKLEISTKLHNWQSTPHVMHMPYDRARYIGVITEQWKKASIGSIFFDSD